jgi:hypothetical protein
MPRKNYNLDSNYEWVYEVNAEPGTLSKIRQLIHKPTGQIIKTEEAVFITHSDRQGDIDFIKLYRENIIDVIRKKELSSGAFGVLFLCVTFVDWQSNFLVHPDTRTPLSISGLEALTGFTRKTLSENLETLKQYGFISLLSRGNGRSPHILLNTNLAFRGKRINDINQVKHSNATSYAPSKIIKYKEVEHVQAASLSEN